MSAQTTPQLLKKNRKLLSKATPKAPEKTTTTTTTPQPTQKKPSPGATLELPQRNKQPRLHPNATEAHILRSLDAMKDACLASAHWRDPPGGRLYEDIMLAMRDSVDAQLAEGGGGGSSSSTPEGRLCGDALEGLYTEALRQKAVLREAGRERARLLEEEIQRALARADGKKEGGK